MHPPIRPYVLAETNWKTVKDTDYVVAVLPWGATEAHNYHLPYATDNIQVEHIAAEAAGLAWQDGARCIVLPAIPFGVNTGQHDIKLDINLNPSTQLKVLDDVIASVQRAGISKFLVLNGHGGNDFKQMLRELQLKYRDMFLCSANWFQMDEVHQYFDNPGDHAGDLETSLMLHLSPRFVLNLDVAGDGFARKFSISALSEGWAWAEREWSKVTKDTGVGNPQNATADKGKAFFKASAQKIAAFLKSLSEADIDDMYD
jgi:creatinine amidohydrolase